MEQGSSGLPNADPERETGPHRAAVLRWVDALNSRELERILAAVRPDVEFRPLRLTASQPVYRGHEGIRRWFDEVSERRHEILPSGFEQLAGGSLLVLGEIVLAGQGRPTDFAGIFRVADDLIADAAHYLSDREMLARIGVVTGR